MPLFSILVPSYNRPELIAQTVSSVLANKFEDFELIISDDKSPRQAEIKTVLQPFLHDRRVRLYLQTQNLREPANRDFLFSKASGTFLIVLGDDDLLYPHALSSLSNWIQRNPGAGVYAFGYTIIDQAGTARYSRKAPKPLTVSVANPSLARELVVSDCFPFWMYHPATFCASSEVHRRIQSRLDVGIGDDLMFMIDFINRGGVFQIIPDILMCYRKVFSDASYSQLNQSYGALSQLIARTKITRLLSERDDFCAELSAFVKSNECRRRMLYDAIIWSGLPLYKIEKELELTTAEMHELQRLARSRPLFLYRYWLLLRRAIFFFTVFGFAGLREMGRVALERSIGLGRPDIS